MSICLSVVKIVPVITGELLYLMEVGHDQAMTLNVVEVIRSKVTVTVA